MHHPLETGTFSHKAQGTWVRHKDLGFIGSISYAQRTGPLHPSRPSETLVWVVMPPKPVNRDLKVFSAGCYKPDELVKTRPPL